MSRFNYHFTTEAAYWFRYESGNTYSIDFDGDDDFRAFVNGRPVVDAGGIHQPTQRGSAFDPDSIGLVDGNIYEVKFFHAKRQNNYSTFKLTLIGFESYRTRCEPSPPPPGRP